MLLRKMYVNLQDVYQELKNKSKTLCSLDYFKCFLEFS